MIKSTAELVLELKSYENPYTKIARLVKDNKLFKIKKGIYETNENVDPFFLAHVIYGPSYISFQSALSYYSLIPERVYMVTSATTDKHKTKIINNRFGSFIYKDVPNASYSYGIYRVEKDGYVCFMATKEKAICDMLYEYGPVYSIKDLKRLLFDDLRIDENEFNKMDFNEMSLIASLYHTTNHKLLIKYLKGKRKC